MFSPEASVQGSRSSLRNPRRRQRKDSDGPQQPRRKRNKLSEDTFLANGDAHINGNGNGNATPNGHGDHGEADESLVLVSMPVREKQLTVKRAVKEDAAQYLTKNENYSVKKLPCFPASLSQASTPFRAFALPSAGLAVALTSTHALAWDYTATTGPARPVTLPLPFGSRPSDPLPLGAIVRNGAASEFGVLAVAASRGKIVYWENVDSAEVRSHFAQRQQGVEGSVKMYSGEVVTGLVDIEHAGYIIVFSSGRMSHLTLRDAQGRPSIATHAMNAPNSSSGSFFSFKGLLGHVRKSIASVKAHQSDSKGQMEVITATKNGVFQVWDLSWSGQQMFKGEVDIHTVVQEATQSGTLPEARGQQDAHILDFAILDKQIGHGVALLALVALSSVESIEYSLLELVLSQNAAVVHRAIPIRNFHQSQVPKEPTGVLLLPAPGITAFVQFPGAIVVASLAETEDGPDAQLLSDSGRSTLPFQDTVYLHDDRHLRFCGSASETPIKKEQRSSAIFFIQGYGMIQISALPQPTDKNDIGRHKVTAKSKLEQVTFFSPNPDNILDFSIKSRYTFGQQEVENAAWEISQGILSSSYDYVDKITMSMEEQMRHRAAALRTLITHLQAEYPQMSFPVRMQLLWNAERLAAAQALWAAYEERVRDKQARPDSYPESLLLPHMVKAVHEKFKTKLQPELGETDTVRHFFIKDIAQMDKLIPHAWHTLRAFYIEKSSQRASVMQRLSEGNDAFLTGLESAFKFREDNLVHYGLNPDIFNEGLLMPNQGQDMMPNFWTSTHNMVSALRSIVDAGRNLAEEAFEINGQDVIAIKIAADNPDLVKLSCKTHIERFTWALAQTDEKDRAMGKALQDDWNRVVRPGHIYNLVAIGQAIPGMDLAEHYNDMPTLARLVWNEIQFLEMVKESASSKMEHAECTVKLKNAKERIHRYFNKYGTAWAKAFYSRYIEQRRSEQLFHKEYLNQPRLTEFLRSQPALGKLAWINEVSGEKEYEAAHDALVTVASTRETNAWCKKVELSIAKLSLLCTRQKSADGEDQTSAEMESKLAQTNRCLEYAQIQDKVYDRIAPIILVATDDESAVEMLMAEFGQGRLNDRPAHQQLLKQGFESLLQHRVLEPALLIDVLTLMTYDETTEPTELVQSNEFAFALKVLALSWYDLTKPVRKSMLRLIWKRLCIKDDWAAINQSAKDLSDEELAAELSVTAVGWTIKSILADESLSRMAPPSDLNTLLGAGCTNGELCVRFGSEDLRNPIIADNLADDEILQANLEKHRLSEWFVQAGNAAKNLLETGSQLALEDGEAEEDQDVTITEVEAQGEAKVDEGSHEQTYASIATKAGAQDVVMLE